MTKALRRIVVSIVLCFSHFWLLSGSERLSILQGSDAVVVGKVQWFAMYPWIDGWHFFGTIRVTRVMWAASSIESSISYRLICDCCTWWPVSQLLRRTADEGIWVLRKVDHSQRFESAGTCGDPGFRPMLYEEEFRLYLARRAGVADRRR